MKKAGKVQARAGGVNPVGKSKMPRNRRRRVLRKKREKVGGERTAKSQKDNGVG